jgi:A/G-specific adenine glycosylase
MELGATICTPRKPGCGVCPLGPACAARAQDAPEAYPARPARRRVPHVNVAVAIVADAAGRILVQRRADDAMLGGLWEFPGGKVEETETPREACRRELAEEVGLDVEVGAELTCVAHTYSHFSVALHAFTCRMDTLSTLTDRGRQGQPLRWATPAELADLAMPRANRKIIEALPSGYLKR